MRIVVKVLSEDLKAVQSLAPGFFDNELERPSHKVTRYEPAQFTMKSHPILSHHTAFLCSARSLRYFSISALFLPYQSRPRSCVSGSPNAISPQFVASVLHRSAMS